jgi:hypothetical protein
MPVLHQGMANVAEPGRLPVAFQYRGASGSVVLACVLLERFSPWKLRSAFRPGPSSSRSRPSYRRKLLSEAQASISVPATEK